MPLDADALRIRAKFLARAASWLLILAMAPFAKVLWEGGPAFAFPGPMPQYPEPPWSRPAVVALCVCFALGIGSLVAAFCADHLADRRSRPDPTPNAGDLQSKGLGPHN